MNETIQVRDRVLQPGKYVFKLLDTNADRHVVQIFNGDQTRIIDTIIAIPNYRLEPTGHSRFTFYETPAGHAKALRAWFYPGDNFGQEFPYPKHLAVIETAAVSAPRAIFTPGPRPEPEAFVPAQPAPEPMAAPEPAPAPQPQEMAQSTPPPAPAPMDQPAPAPMQQTEKPVARLPKTATVYPLLGLGGLLSLAAFGLLRLRRTA